MRDGHASRTAEHNALFRALESSRPASRRLFKDPLARAFLTWPFAIVTRLAVIPGFRELVPWVIDNRWPGVRSSVVARTRLIDDVIASSVGEHPEQLVILGAGFDSRRIACRACATSPSSKSTTQIRRQPNDRRWNACSPRCRSTFGSLPSTSISGTWSLSCPPRATARGRARSFCGKA